MGRRWRMDRDGKEIDMGRRSGEEDGKGDEDGDRDKMGKEMDGDGERDRDGNEIDKGRRWRCVRKRI
jgi:hypothetical protein